MNTQYIMQKSKSNQHGLRTRFGMRDSGTEGELGNCGSAAGAELGQLEPLEHEHHAFDNGHSVAAASGPIRLDQDSGLFQQEDGASERQQTNRGASTERQRFSPKIAHVATDGDDPVGDRKIEFESSSSRLSDEDVDEQSPTDEMVGQLPAEPEARQEMSQADNFGTEQMLVDVKTDLESLNDEDDENDTMLELHGEEQAEG